MNIVCIEPDIVLAKAYKKVFSTTSNTVTLCLDPQAAIEKLDEHIPDVIVMELQLAPLSGFAFLHELRSYEDFSSIPVIIYSSVPKESFNVGKDIWLSLGVVAYLYKSTDSLQKVLQKIKGLQHAE